MDPLVFIEPARMSPNDRSEYYERLKIWSRSPLNGVVLSDEDIKGITDFLGTLSYESTMPVEEVD